MFALGLVQGEWKMYVKRPLDREEQDLYLLNITASDGLFVTRALVEVTVKDTNDNRPVCQQVSAAASPFPLQTAGSHGQAKAICLPALPLPLAPLPWRVCRRGAPSASVTGQCGPCERLGQRRGDNTSSSLCFLDSYLQYGAPSKILIALTDRFGCACIPQI